MATTPCDVDNEEIRSRARSRRMLAYIPIIGGLITQNVESLQPPIDGSATLGTQKGKYTAELDQWEVYATKDIYKNSNNIQNTLSSLHKYVDAITDVLKEKVDEKAAANYRLIVMVLILLLMKVLFF